MHHPVGCLHHHAILLGHQQAQTFAAQGQQGISYGLPAFILDGDVVCGIAARKNGCSYYPFSGSVLAALKSDLVKFKQTKSALHFDAPLPKTLVRKLMTQRMVQIMIKKKRR